MKKTIVTLVLSVISIMFMMAQYDKEVDTDMVLAVDGGEDYFCNDSKSVEVCWVARGRRCKMGKDPPVTALIWVSVPRRAYIISGDTQLCETNRRPVCQNHRTNQCSDHRLIY